MSFFLWNPNLEVSFLFGDNFFRPNHSIQFLSLHIDICILFVLIYISFLSFSSLSALTLFCSILSWPLSFLHGIVYIIPHICCCPAHFFSQPELALFLFFPFLFFADLVLNIQEKIKSRSLWVLKKFPKASCKFDSSLWVNLNSPKNNTFTSS